MTTAQKRTLATSLLVGVGGPLVVWLITTAARSAVDGKLDAQRFVSDSIRRDALRTEDRALLLRIDSTSQRTDQRLRAIWCADKPPGCQ